MSLRGIDAQMMVNRSLDASAEQAKNARLHDVTQNQIAHINKQNAEAERGKTQSVNKAEHQAIKSTSDEERNQGGESLAEKKESKPEQKETRRNPDLDLPVGKGEQHKIDIQV